MKNADMPAMPILGDTDGFISFLDGTKGGRNYGITKREHFAAMAMQGMIASKFSSDFGAEINDSEYNMAQGRS
jgi:hypothetical protein